MEWIGLRNNWCKAAVTTVTLLLIVGLVTWQIYSPERTMKHLRRVAVQGNTVELSGWIDLPAVRTSAKAQARIESRRYAEEERQELDRKDWKNRSPEFKESIYKKAEIEAALSFCRIDSTIDRWLTVADVGGVILNGRAGVPIEPGVTNDPILTLKREWRIEHRAWDEFRAVMPGELPVILVFKRRGIGWTITKMLMPKGGLAPWTIAEPPPQGWSKNSPVPSC